MAKGVITINRLTFKGFLKKYLKDLSLSNTNSITVLLNEVNVNGRLLEPLLLCIKICDRSDYINDIQDNFVKQEYKYLLGFENIEQALELGELPYGYQKVYTSYVCERDRLKNEAHTKSILLERIKQLKASKSISNYKIAKELNLNQSNVRLFIAQGILQKISLVNAKIIYEYLNKK